MNKISIFHIFLFMLFSGFAFASTPLDSMESLETTSLESLKSSKSNLDSTKLAYNDFNSTEATHVDMDLKGLLCPLITARAGTLS